MVLTHSFLPYLTIGITVDSAQLSGTDSDCQILWNKWVRTLTRVALPVLNSTGGSSSGPVALLSFNRLIASLTSVSVGDSLDTVRTETGSVIGWVSGWGCCLKSAIGNVQPIIQSVFLIGNQRTVFSLNNFGYFYPLGASWSYQLKQFCAVSWGCGWLHAFRSHQFSRSWRRLCFTSRSSFRLSWYLVPGAILRRLKQNIWRSMGLISAQPPRSSSFSS